ncbi:MAG: phosphatase PAP2 family protein [Porphyromonas sp.]|nr:phosphatase PAP2 family protein [Porphyromonas sp.]
MLENFILWEKDLFLYLNGLHCSATLDAFMFLISAKWPWVMVCCALIIFLFYKKPSREALLFIVVAVLLMVVTDQLSSQLIKPLVARLRPTFHPETAALVQTVYGYKAGGYSFVSGHATNFFAIATFTSIVFRNKWYSWVVFLTAFTIAYSRIYLGVHFISDVVCGALLGFFVAFLFALLYHRIREFLFGKKRTGTKKRMRLSDTDKLFAPTIKYWTAFMICFIVSLWFLGAQVADIVHLVSVTK